VFKPGWKIASVGALAASLGLSACGVQASLDKALTSVGSSPYLQIHLTASASGLAPGGDQVEQALPALSFDVYEASTNGGALAQSSGQINSEVKVNAGSHTLADLRDIGANVYVLVDVSALSAIPGVNLSPAELGSLAMLVGGRWFELPASLVNSYIPAASKDLAPTAKDQAVVQQLIKDVTGVIEATKYTTLPDGGYSQTGTLDSIAKAVLPAIGQLGGTATSNPAVPGTYKVSITMSGSSATGGSMQITAPNGASGNATVGLTATISHATLDVVTPAGATTITPAMVKLLMGQATAAQ